MLIPLSKKQYKKKTPRKLSLSYCEDSEKKEKKGAKGKYGCKGQTLSWDPSLRLLSGLFTASARSRTTGARVCTHRIGESLSHFSRINAPQVWAGGRVTRKQSRDSSAVWLPNTTIRLCKNAGQIFKDKCLVSDACNMIVIIALHTQILKYFRHWCCMKTTPFFLELRFGNIDLVSLVSPGMFLNLIAITALYLKQRRFFLSYRPKCANCCI